VERRKQGIGIEVINRCRMGGRGDSKQGEDGGGKGACHGVLLETYILWFCAFAGSLSKPHNMHYGERGEVFLKLAIAEARLHRTMRGL
jgi:hypothetical protein